jgi:hypothetical protein
MENNVFINKTLFYSHQLLEFRERRLSDFESLYQKLKPHLKPTNFVQIDEKIKMNYINAHKKQNRQDIEDVLNSMNVVTFNELQSELIKHAKSFKPTKYIYVVGATSNMGEDLTNFDLFKSNVWTFMLLYEHLPVKPYDIILNLSSAIKLHLKDVKDFLITDDASYSGFQLVDNIIKPAATDLTFATGKEGYKITSRMYSPITEKTCNLHLMIPYMSSLAIDKLNQMDSVTGFCFVKYISKVVLTLGQVLNFATYKNVAHLFNQFYPNSYFGDLIPLYFDYKIADMISTLEIMFIKGKVLDDPSKRIVFIKDCLSGKAGLYEKMDCPVPPYKKFYALIYSN